MKNLREVSDRGEKDFYELLDALRDWPKLPSPYILHQIGGHCGEWPADWYRGKSLQNQLVGDDIERIPFTAECEKAAGFWDRITNGAWREVEPEGSPFKVTDAQGERP
jgi:hypothetical protein